MSTQFKTGINNNYPFDAYRAISAANKSTLAIAINKTFAHMHEYQNNPPEITPIQQKNFNMGHLFECLLTTPKQFDKHFIITPDFNLRTKQGKADKQDLIESNPNKRLITQEEYDKATAMVKSALSHPAVKDLLSQPYDTSVAVTAIDPLTGEPIKGLIDVLPRTGSTVIDIKTCVDASPSGASKTIANFSYYLQAYMYLHLLNLNDRKVDEFVFIFCEKESPYATAVYTLSPESIDYGRREYERLIKAYSEAKKSGVWQGYSDYVEEICLPSWMTDSQQVTLNGESV